jgi:hypothetical protein
MTDLKQRLAVVLASPEGKAMIEDGQQFYIEELQAAFVQVLAQANDHDRVVLEAAINAVIARKAKGEGKWPGDIKTSVTRLGNTEQGRLGSNGTGRGS